MEILRVASLCHAVLSAEDFQEDLIVLRAFERLCQNGAKPSLQAVLLSLDLVTVSVGRALPTICGHAGEPPQAALVPATALVNS